MSRGAGSVERKLRDIFASSRETHAHPNRRTHALSTREQEKAGRLPPEVLEAIGRKLGIAHRIQETLPSTPVSGFIRGIPTDMALRCWRGR